MTTAATTLFVSVLVCLTRELYKNDDDDDEAAYRIEFSFFSFVRRFIVNHKSNQQSDILDCVRLSKNGTHHGLFFSVKQPDHRKKYHASIFMTDRYSALI